MRITDTLVTQILAVRNIGAVNMFDINGVQTEAHKNGFYELVVFIEDHRESYVQFILTGEQG